MRLLVTGATGFVGIHLLRALASRKNLALVGLSRSGIWPAGADDLTARVRLVSLDLQNGTDLRALLVQEPPDQVIHLAGYASPGRSLADPMAAWAGNLSATLSLYQSLADLRLRPLILAVSSGLVYGDLVQSVPVNEDAPLRPANPYSASKAAADLAAIQYGISADLPIIRARPFNHIGPGQSPDFAVARFAQQLVAIAHGKQAPLLETGNLSPRRDVTDVRDVVAAYLALLERGQPGLAYNIAGGTLLSMQEILDRLIAISGLRVEVRQRADLMRKADGSVPPIDTSRLRTTTGWKPQFTLEQTLRDLLEAGRKAIETG